MTTTTSPSLDPKAKRVALLKLCEQESGSQYHSSLKKHDATKRAQIQKVVFESDLSGIEEFSTLWLELIQQKMIRMGSCRNLIIKELQERGDDSGFNAFERALIIGCARIAEPYDAYYLAYLKAVQDPDTVARLREAPPHVEKQPECYSHYTVVQLKDTCYDDSNGTDELYKAIPFGQFFQTELAPVLEAFDAMLLELRDIATTKEGDKHAASYIAYLQHYRNCLGAATASPEELEDMWTELDHLWMKTKGDIQIVHDIETGYGDPLRVKATPDFSLRFLDSDTYGEENAKIAEIQDHLEEFFRERGTKLANEGLTALKNTQAGIYFIPFKTGVALQFSFSGQSIPNRLDVKEDKGVKIYFDPVETAARVELGKALVTQVFSDPQEIVLKYKPDAVEQLVWHVAAHEVGHAIYNLRSVEDTLGSAIIVNLLEESRAELTAMFTLRLLYQKGVINLPHLQKAVAHFCLDALRYFAKYESEALRAYVIFQIYAFKTYLAQGYLIESEDGKLTIDDGKTLDVLNVFSERFLAILDCEDKGDAATLTSFLEEMQQETDAIRRIVAAVNQ